MTLTLALQVLGKISIWLLPMILLFIGWGLYEAVENKWEKEKGDI